MTNPIQRAGNHLHRKIVFGGADSDVFSLAQQVFESIDVEELADVISGWPIGTGYYGTQIGTDEARDLALAVKAHLTGGSND